MKYWPMTLVWKVCIVRVSESYHAHVGQGLRTSIHCCSSDFKKCSEMASGLAMSGCPLSATDDQHIALAYSKSAHVQNLVLSSLAMPAQFTSRWSPFGSFSPTVFAS